jgi:hypothetical protein
MTTCDVVGAEWIDDAREAMQREREVIETGEISGLRLDEIIRYRDQAIGLWEQLLIRVLGEEKVVVDNFISEQKDSVEALTRFLDPQLRSNRTRRLKNKSRNKRLE